jgi:hypothetical protein
MLTGGARWHDDGVEGRKVLRLAYTTNGPLGSHHDIKKGHRECGAVAHRGGGDLAAVRHVAVALHLGRGNANGS